MGKKNDKLYELEMAKKRDHKILITNEAISLYNEATKKNNEANNLKGYQKAASYFLHECYKVGLIYSDR